MPEPSVIVKFTGKPYKFDREKVLRAVVIGLIPVYHDRIHEQGLASDGAPIGEYSKGYMRIRNGISVPKATFFNSDEKTKKKAEKLKIERNARPHINRGPSTKVIASLTRELENSYVAIATEKGYALGTNNAFDYLKTTYLEHTYKKKIFSLTTSERKFVLETIDELINLQKP